MSLYIVEILRPLHGDTVKWYFEKESDAEHAKMLAQEYKIFIDDNIDNPEFITEFHEFESWWNEYKDAIVKEKLGV